MGTLQQRNLKINMVMLILQEPQEMLENKVSRLKQQGLKVLMGEQLQLINLVAGKYFLKNLKKNFCIIQIVNVIYAWKNMRIDICRLTIGYLMKLLAMLTIITGILKVTCCFVALAIEQNLGLVSIVITGKIKRIQVFVNHAIGHFLKNIPILPKKS